MDIIFGIIAVVAILALNTTIIVKVNGKTVWNNNTKNEEPENKLTRVRTININKTINL